MSESRLLWRRANESTLKTLRGQSGGQYDIRLGRSQPVADFFAGLPQEKHHEGLLIEISTERVPGADEHSEIPPWELAIRRMSSESERRDWYIRAQRPTTAHPLWRPGVGPTEVTEPDTDYVLLLRTERDLFYAGWLRGTELSGIPDRLQARMQARDVDAIALDENESAAMLRSLGGPAEEVGPARGGDEPLDEVEQGMAEALEGRKVTARHVRRERSPWLRRRKIEAAGEHPRCETCGFDFEAFYGDRGQGFIECHHLTPVSELTLATRTKLEDLALLCANCHRMIHASRPWIDIGELRELIAQAQVGK